MLPKELQPKSNSDDGERDLLAANPLYSEPMSLDTLLGSNNPIEHRSSIPNIQAGEQKVNEILSAEERKRQEADTAYALNTERCLDLVDKGLSKYESEIGRIKEQHQQILESEEIWYLMKKLWSETGLAERAAISSIQTSRRQLRPFGKSLPMWIRAKLPQFLPDWKGRRIPFTTFVPVQELVTIPTPDFAELEAHYSYSPLFDTAFMRDVAVGVQGGEDDLRAGVFGHIRPLFPFAGEPSSQHLVYGEEVGLTLKKKLLPNLSVFRKQAEETTKDWLKHTTGYNWSILELKRNNKAVFRIAISLNVTEDYTVIDFMCYEGNDARFCVETSSVNNLVIWLNKEAFGRKEKN